jgi:hypothetical protein
MKKSYSILVYLLLTCTVVSAANKHWVGPAGGNWTDDLNWSLFAGGAGGAGRPVSSDAVIFSGSALVNVNTSAVVFSVRTTFGPNKVILYTATGSTITIVNSLRVEPLSTLKDSTSANVPFNVIFSGATHATGEIFGDWIFEGSIALIGSTNGARFTAEDGSFVNVTNSPIFGGIGGRVIFKRNTNIISSSVTTLNFSYGSYYILDNNLNAAIPAATWAKDSLKGPDQYSGVLGAPASTIHLTGSIGQLQILGGVPTYGRFVVDLGGLTDDASLSLPDGSKIRGNLEILNTNNHTLTLLAGTSATSSVQVEVGAQEAGYLFGGYLDISGASTKVALAKATPQAPATSYKLLVNKSYNQTGGNFSLQDYNNAVGSSTLAVKNDIIQTGGTFFTNSTSTSAKFVVVMDDPNFITGPSGDFESNRKLSISSGTIDNGRHMVTLRIDHELYNAPGFESLANGVTLQRPLEVARLELIRSPLTTSATNILTVSDPAVDAISVGNSGKSYVNGPLRRATNSTQPYSFPTGKGASSFTSYGFDSCTLIPASATPSLYQAEYFSAGYPDLNITAPLKGVSNTQYWDISKLSGSDAQVKLTINGAVGGASAGDGLVVAHYVGGHWISENGSVVTPGTTSAGSVVSKQLSSFSPFTIGFANPGDLGPATGNGLSYRFYRGTYDALPDFDALAPLKTGTSANVDLSVRPSGIDYDFAFIWQGYITLPAAGTYTFETISDDGSKLYFNSPYNVNATALVNNDGSHAAQSATGTVSVAAAGAYPITITYYQNSGGESMQVYWSGPGIPRQLIPNTAFSAASQTAVGLNYKFYQGFYGVLPDFNALTPLKTGTSSNVDINVRPLGIDDGFAFMWQGYINIPAPGNYTFETISDDGSKLYFNTPYDVNTPALVNNDGSHGAQSVSGTVNIPAAGLYPVAITFFENSGGQSMQVYWSGPGLSRQQIPDAAFTPALAPQPAGGLNYAYYEGDFNTLPDYNMLTPVKTGTSANTNISVRTPGVNDHFAFKWDGFINIPTAGVYTFETISDDGSKVYFNMPYSVNGNSLVNNDGVHAPASATGTVTIPSAGRYPISITFFEKDGGETMQLYWTAPGISRQLVPDTAFTTTNTAIGTTVMSGILPGNLLNDLKDGKAIQDIATVYPNPFAEHFTVDYYNQGNVKNNVTIAIYDLNGKLLYTYQPSNLLPGYNRWLINLAGNKLVSGTYIAQLKVNGMPTKTVKLLKIR